MKTEETPKLVTFGNGGDTVHFSRCHTCSGYGTPENPHAAHDIPDGTPVIDKRPALETEAGYRFVFAGPMVNVDLADGEIDRCPVPSAVLAASVGAEYQALLAIQQGTSTKETAGALDGVSTAEYIRLWRDLGAKVGKYQGGVIIWE